MLPLKQEYFSILKYFIQKNKNIGNLVRSRECNRNSKKPLSHQHYLFFREMMTKLDLKHHLLKSKIIQ